MTEKRKPSVVELIETLIYRIGVRTIPPTLLTVIFLGSIVFVWLHYERMNILLSSLEKNLSQSILLGDKIHISNQFESLVKSETVSGVWLYDSHSQNLIAYDSSLVDFMPKFESTLPVLSFVSTDPVVFLERKIRDRDGETIGSLKICVVISVRGCLAFVLFFVVSLLGIVYFFAKNLRDIGLSIARPIEEFSTALSRQKTLENNIPRPNSSYEEIDGLYDKYRNLMNQLKVAERFEKEAAIGRITAQLSHDLRAPLSSIERILYADKTDPIGIHQGLIRESIMRLHAMIESLRHTDAETLISPVQSKISFTTARTDFGGRLRERGIELLYPEKISFSARVDYPKFSRAWMNLVSNAVEAAKSLVRIEIDSINSDLILRVIDDGPGISDHILSRLFQRGSTYGKTDGTGLGLAYVRQIMRGHGGDVTYRRENDRTIFECILPNAVEPEKDPSMEKSAILGVKLQQKVIRKVAVCLEPEDLSLSVMAKLASLKSDEFLFIRNREDASIVVSNIESIMLEVIESDEQEYMSMAQIKSDEAWMIEILKRRFNLI